MRPTVKLGELADLQNGYAFKSSDYISKSKTLNFRMSNIRPGGIVDIEYNKKFLPDEYAEIYKDFLLKDGDVVIAMTDMATSPKILAVPCIVNTGGYNVLLNQRVGKFFNVDETRIRKDFLWAVLSSSKIREGLASLGGGGLQINISKKQILDIQIPLPPLITQKAIVAKLDQIFAELDQTKSEIQKNLDNTDELWKSALNQAFQGDWEMKTLQDVCLQKITDGTHQTPTYCGEKEGIPFISSKDVTKEYIDREGGIKFIPQSLHEELYARIAPQKDDVLLAKNGTTGVAAIVEDGRTFDIYVTLAVLRPNQKIITPRFLHRIVNSPICKRQFDKSLKGAGVPNLHLENIKTVTIPVPPLSEQKRIVEHLDQVSKEVKALKFQYQSQLDNLEELKKSVLDKAFKGELE